MAVISHRHRCIYVKMPKCASTSLLDWFIAHAGGRHSFAPFWYPGTLPHRLQRLAHALELYPGYFTFTFLRDPYRRFVSLYRHANHFARQRALSVPHHPKNNGTLGEFAELCAELLDDTRGLWGPGATAFLRLNGGRRYGPLGIPLRHLSFVFNHVRPQVDFLPDCNPERLFGRPRPAPGPLGFIGAVETLDADFSRLQARLGLPRVPLFRHDLSAPAPPGSTPPRYDDATRRLVGALYAEDFAFAGGLPDDASAAPRNAHLIHPPAPAPRVPRVPLAMRLRRARFTLASLEIGLEVRVRRTAAVLRRPLTRLRRRLG